ncbi:pseudouridine synthase [Spiroplasma endosymbiont of Virgichneumon dumeticola]|uniref:pseudouridine synthase n=1 Tax=Spiroplasma endosymbiont of Virgichneumon dumeticola TaxID=3139323 RepID=UPI0035C8A4E4
MTNSSERLQKVIAAAGICSRRKAELLITNGQVVVNEQVITTLGFKVNPQDIIKVNGQVINQSQHIYIAFYKPPNCLSTVSDPKNRATVMDYFRNITTRIYPIGRLDFDTSGLLLMTNDGEFTNAIIHPRYKVDKIYQVLAQGILPANAIRQLEVGVVLDSAFTSSPATVDIIRTDIRKQTTLLHLTIHEGQNQQVKRMMKSVGSRVVQLKRLQVGNITLKGLTMGKYRYLQPEEVQLLLQLSQEG